MGRDLSIKADALSIEFYQEDYIEKPCSAPTEERPGSLAKIEVLCERARRGEAIFHNQDATHVGAIGGRVCQADSGRSHQWGVSKLEKRRANG